MKDKVDCVIKSGIVESTDKKTIKVRIQNESACAMCYSKGVCTSLGSNERVIEVEADNHSVKPGDIVDIKMVTTSGIVAVLYGYIFPFILLISTLLIASSFTSEGFAALLSLLILIPYFLSLYFLRNKMKKYFRFTLS